MAKNLAQCLVVAFLAILALGVAPLWAQQQRAHTRAPIGPPAGPESADRAENPAAGGDRSFEDFVAESKVLGGEAEALEAPTAPSSATATAYAVGYPAPLPAERLTIETKEGKPLEVKVVNAPGGRAVQIRWREKTRWRTRIVRVPIGATPVQVQRMLDEALAGLVSKTDLQSLFEAVNGRLGQMEKEFGQQISCLSDCVSANAVGTNRRLDRIEKSLSDQSWLIVLMVGLVIFFVVAALTYLATQL